MEAPQMSMCFRSVLGGFFICSATTVWPYDQPVTHPALSSRAARISALYDGLLMARLGRPPTSVSSFRYRGRNGDRTTQGTTTYNLAQLIGEGAFDEDEGVRALNHFYDPLLDRPLTPSPLPSRRSWQWMLETNGPISGQDRSLSDAKDYFYQALTFNEGSPRASDTERGKNWGLLFLSLGGAVHHMQDMAQPQHVRNDQHCDTWYCLTLNNPSLYETYTAQKAGRVDAIAAFASPMYPGPTEFTQLRHFWFNYSETYPGIAEFTNRHFVSQGTN
ncbi:MAG: hypothetical protein ACREXX_07190, partial [Gammaproteobacteria bacterium]